MARGIEKINVIGSIGVGKSYNLKPNIKYSIEAIYHKGTLDKDKGKAKWKIKAPHSELSKNGDIIGITIPPKFCGPKPFYVEAYVFKPSNKYPTMLGFSCKAPERIVSTKWSKTNGGSDIRKHPIDHGESVYLNIETEGLNGAILTIEIYTTSGDDPLIQTITKVKCERGMVNLKIDSTFGWYTDYFGEQEFYIKVKLGRRYIKDKIGDNKHARFLRINKQKAKTREKKGFQNIKPLTVGKSEINIERYESCKYKKVKIDYEGEKPVIVFDQENSKTMVNKEVVIPIVVGPDTNRKKIKFLLDGLNTAQCSHRGKKQHHEQTLINYNNLNYKIKNYNTNKSDNFNPEKSKHNVTFVNGISKMSFQEAWSVMQKSQPPSIINSDVKKFKIEAGYDYTFGGTATVLGGFSRTMFPASDSNAQKYTFGLNTCAYKRSVVLALYPDTKCTIQLKFNYSKSNFNKLTQIYHKTWELKKLSAEKHLKELEPKLEEADYYEVPDRDLYSKNHGLTESLNEANKNLTRRRRALNLVKTPLSSSGCDFTLMAEFDKEGKIDLTTEAQEIIDFIKTIVRIKDKILNVFKGKDSDTNTKKPKKQGNIDARLKTLTDKLDKKKASGMKKEKWKFEFIPPSIGLSASWSAKALYNKSVPVIGTEVKAALDLNPLFGFQVEYDIFQLLYKIKHPVVLGIVATLDVLDEALGDNFDIDITFTITSQLNAKLQGVINTADSDNKIQQEGTQGNVGGTVKGELKANVQANGRIATFVFGKYDAYGELSGVGELGFGIDFVIKADTKGIFTEPTMKFDGLTLKGVAKFGVSKAGKNSEMVSNASVREKYGAAMRGEVQGVDRSDSDRGKHIGGVKGRTGVHYKVEKEMIILTPRQWPKEGEPNPFKVYLKNF